MARRDSKARTRTIGMIGRERQRTRHMARRLSNGWAA